MNIFQPKPAAAAPAAAAAPSPSPAPSSAAAAPAPAAAPAAAPVAAAAPNAEHVRQLTEMGFPEDQVTAALRAAMGNPDVAVEFLMTGIPDNIPVGVQPACNGFFTNLMRTSLLPVETQEYPKLRGLVRALLIGKRHRELQTRATNGQQSAHRTHHTRRCTVQIYCTNARLAHPGGRSL